eukprot:Lankesteria_metandrocarpae@DN5826_c0_g1_i1.p1
MKMVVVWHYITLFLLGSQAGHSHPISSARNRYSNLIPIEPFDEVKIVTFENGTKTQNRFPPFFCAIYDCFTTNNEGLEQRLWSGETFLIEITKSHCYYYLRFREYNGELVASRIHDIRDNAFKTHQQRFPVKIDYGGDFGSKCIDTCASQGQGG